MANVDIRVGKKDAVFFSANPTLILKDGQFLFNSDTLELFIGDGTSQLSALVAINVPPSSGVQSVTGPNVDDTDPVNPVVNVPTWDETLTDDNTTTKSPIITDATLTLNQSLGNQNVDIQYDYIKVQDGLPTPLIEANTTTGQLQKRGVDIATVNDIPSLSGYVDTAGLTTNTIPKATASDTIGDSSITDDGTTVTVNSPTVITSDNSNNQVISIDNLKALVAHDVKILFNSPIYSFANMQANETVETDASKNLVSVAKGTAYNKDFGTAAGTVLEGNRITQTITNGVTDKVPSEDAVFDWVTANYQPKKFSYIDTSLGTLSSGASNTLSKSVLIPANTLTSGLLNIKGRSVKTGTGSFGWLNVYVNTSNSMSGAVLIGQMNNAANNTILSWAMERNIPIQSGSFTAFIVNNTAGSETVITNNTATVTIDWTVDQYIILAVQANNGAESLRANFFSVNQF